MGKGEQEVKRDGLKSELAERSLEAMTGEGEGQERLFDRSGGRGGKKEVDSAEISRDIVSNVRSGAVSTASRYI